MNCAVLSDELRFFNRARLQPRHRSGKLSTAVDRWPERRIQHLDAARSHVLQVCSEARGEAERHAKRVMDPPPAIRIRAHGEYGFSTYTVWAERRAREPLNVSLALEILHIHNWSQCVELNGRGSMSDGKSDRRQLRDGRGDAYALITVIPGAEIDQIVHRKDHRTRFEETARYRRALHSLEFEPV